jgi:hypothetical protein
LNREELQKKVRQTVQQLVLEKGFVSPLDLLLKMEKISLAAVKNWRFGRVPFLEREVRGNLSQLNFILNKLHQVAREMELKESHTAYMSWGKGTKQPLRFSKSGDAHTERRYSTHFVESVKKRITLST